MKTICILSLFIAISLSGFTTLAQSAVAKDTEWLEKELNTLAKTKKPTGTQEFDFNECACKYSAKVNDGGFNMDKNFTFNLDEINNISYAKNDDDSYELRMKMKTDSEIVEFLDLGVIKTTLYTSDENKIKEIVKKLKTSVKTCSDGKASAPTGR